MDEPADLSLDLSTKKRVHDPPRQLEQRIRNVSNSVPISRTLRPRNSNPVFYGEFEDLDEEILNGNGYDSEDEGMPPSPKMKIVSEEEFKDMEKRIRLIKEQLRNEEVNLVLMKKLHHSQKAREVPPPPPPAAPSPAPMALTTKPPVVPAKPPPPKIPQQNSAMPPLIRPMWSHLQRSGKSSSILPPSSSVLNYQNRDHAVQNLSSRPARQSSPNEPGESPAQRQAAAKLALRKQLEKTLLHIPPPKPPPPELNFIPNPNNAEFIYLLGLESAVNYITDDQGPGVPKVPFECAQCKTNFSPIWKWEDGKRRRVICEDCITTNIKKALKAEHTNRLKAAFVKALQQEQEIEEQMTRASRSPPVTSSHHGLPKSTAAQINHLSKIVDQVRPIPQDLGPSPHQLMRMAHQPMPAHMMAPFNPLMGYPYPLPSMLKTSDLQRQYLLDMIPPRLMASHGWKC